ncbi:hypothetical protein JCM10212_006090 [Sporobolomyces blumeae]
MSGLLQRYSSYSSSGANHHIRPSPASAAPEPPTDPFPPVPNALKPSDVLINRSHQVKRFAKHLSLYFQGLAQAHHAHSITLNKLPSLIPTPIQEASIFLPAASSSSSTHPDSSSTGADAASDPSTDVAPLGGTGQEGWAQILQGVKDTNARVADAHAELARRITKEVVGPLTKLRETMKGHINAMEKDVNRLCDAVQKERDLTAPLLARLSTSLSHTPIRPQPSDDPLVIRAQLEAQLAVQVHKENELLTAVKNWTDKTEAKEREVLSELARCWRDWETSNSAMLLGNQQLSMFLSATVDSVPPESEWIHFLRLNHAIPRSTPLKSIEHVAWEGKGDERCDVVREGVLERQTSFLRSWKPAYFILTPTGQLLLYPPPQSISTASASASASSLASPTRSTRSSTSSLPAPPPMHHSRSGGGGALTPPLPTTPPAVPEGDAASTSPGETAVGDDATLSSSSTPPTSASTLSAVSPIAFHLLTSSTPLLSLYLPTCSIGPMPTPSSSSTPTKGGLDAAFTITENEGKGTKHIVRARKSDDAWEEMGKWVAEISRFTLPAPPSPGLPSPPESPALGTAPSSSATNGAFAGPPPLPNRSLAAGSATLPTSPPLPSIPQPSPPGLSSSNLSSEFPPESDGDLSSVQTAPAATSGGGVGGLFGSFFGGARSSVPPALPPRDRTLSGQSLDADASEISTPRIDGPLSDDATHANAHVGAADDDEEERGDLGRSLSPPLVEGGSHAYVSGVGRGPAPTLPPRNATRDGRGGKVASLAKAFDDEADKNRPGRDAGDLGGVDVVRGPAEREEDERDQEDEKDQEDDEANTSTETAGEGENVTVGEGHGDGEAKKPKKGKKKRKSKGKKGDHPSEAEADPALSISIPAPTESSPRSADVSLSSPPLDNSTLNAFDEAGDASFELNLERIRLGHEVEGEEGEQGPGDLSFDQDKLEREYGSGGEGGQPEEDVKSPPPMVLEEPEDAPPSLDEDGVGNTHGDDENKSEDGHDRKSHDEHEPAHDEKKE